MRFIHYNQIPGLDTESCSFDKAQAIANKVASQVAMELNSTSRRDAAFPDSTYAMAGKF